MIAAQVADISQVLQSIPEIIRDPGADPRATAALLVAAVLVALIIAVTVALLLVGPSDQEEEGAEGGEISEEDEVGGSPAPGAEGRPRTPARTRIVGIAVVVTLLAVVAWAATGIATGTRSVCLSCHESNPHAGSAAVDPHADVACVRCHEVGDAVTLAVFTLPDRAAHFLAGVSETGAAAGYGHPISSLACEACHEGSLDSPSTSERTGVRMSHAEPLDAGSECIDCHALRSGVVSLANVGMTPCLRCHDGVAASAECETCHTRDPSLAIASTEPTAGTLAKVQVPLPQCDGCHVQEEEGCDDCHGIRLPHTREFVQYAHARPAVIDIWDGGGIACVRCHYPGRRDCSECHDPFPSHGYSWETEHGIGVRFTAECGCHKFKAYAAERQFCEICHDTEPPGTLR